jgi:hypothetical protein
LSRSFHQCALVTDSHASCLARFYYVCIVCCVLVSFPRNVKKRRKGNRKVQSAKDETASHVELKLHLDWIHESRKFRLHYISYYVRRTARISSNVNYVPVIPRLAIALSFARDDYRFREVQRSRITLAAGKIPASSTRGASIKIPLAIKTDLPRVNSINSTARAYSTQTGGINLRLNVPGEQRSRITWPSVRWNGRNYPVPQIRSACPSYVRAPLLLPRSPNFSVETYPQSSCRY